MGPVVIDLYSIRFWATVAVAVLVLAPIARAGPRRWAWAAINLGFLAAFLGADVGPVIAGVVAAHLALKLIERDRLAPAILVLGGAAALGLFVVHKRPGLSGGAGMRELESILRVIGYSYMVL